MKNSIRLIVIAVAVLFSIVGFHEIQPIGPSYTARVVSVADGDTVTVMKKNEKTKIRLFGIDCPEKLQPFGKSATEFTNDLLANQDVRVFPVHQDRYGRTVAYLVLRKGGNLNYMLVSSGLAWWSQNYAPDEWNLAARELIARLNGKGLWSDPDPTPPWDFRKGATRKSSINNFLRF